MSEQEIKDLEQKELSFTDQVDVAWKYFWNRRGVTAGLSGANSTPNWYNRAYHEEEQHWVYASMLEPDELIARAISRKLVLNRS
jgi:hypothetical protein